MGPGVNRATLKSLSVVEGARDSRPASSHARVSRSGMAWKTVEKPRRLDRKTAISADGIGRCVVWKTKREAGLNALPRVVYDAAGRAVRSAHDGDRLLLLRGVFRLALRRFGDVGDANRPVDA